MKRLSYLLALTLMICTLCACNDNDSDTNAENSGNFSTEMIIEPSTDVTIVEMP